MCRGNLEAVKCIPTGTQRGRLLHEHALVALLKRVLPVKVLAPSPIQSWFSDLQDQHCNLVYLKAI